MVAGARSSRWAIWAVDQPWSWWCWARRTLRRRASVRWLRLVAPASASRAGWDVRATIDASGSAGARLPAPRWGLLSNATVAGRRGGALPRRSTGRDPRDLARNGIGLDHQRVPRVPLWAGRNTGRPPAVPSL